MASGGGKCSKGGSGKSRGGGGKTTNMLSKELKTPKEFLVSLRAALFNSDGTDRNVLNDFQPFCLYRRNNLDISLEFFSGGLMRKEEDVCDTCLEITKDNMKPIYAGNFEWVDEDKEEDLKEKSTRHIVCFDNSLPGREVIGYATLCFTLQGALYNEMSGESCLLVKEIQIRDDYQRKGLGKHLFQLMTLIAKKQSMHHIMVQYLNINSVMNSFLQSKTKKFFKYNGSSLTCSNTEKDYVVYNKSLNKKQKQSEQEKAKLEAQMLARKITLLHMASENKNISFDFQQKNEQQEYDDGLE